MSLIIDQTPMTQALDIDETSLHIPLGPVRFNNNKAPQHAPSQLCHADPSGKPDTDLLRLGDVGSPALPPIHPLFECAALPLKLCKE